MVVYACASVEKAHAYWTMLPFEEKPDRVLCPMPLKLAKTELLICSQYAIALLAGVRVNVGSRGAFYVVCIFRHFKVSKRRGQMLLECFRVSARTVFDNGFNAGFHIARGEISEPR